MLYSLITITSGVYIGLIILLFIFQSYYIYHPDPDVTDTPALYQLPFEEVYLQTADQIKLHGWFVPVANPRATLLFFHGNAGNITYWLEFLNIFHQLGFNSFHVDYRGFGKSGGSPSENGTYQDAMAAWNYLVTQRQLAPTSIILHGQSLGGAVAGWLATQQTSKALILESTFTSVPAMASELFPYLPVRWLTRYQYNTLENLKKIHCPILIIHSPDDEIIPFAHGQKLFAEAPEPKTFLQIQGEHNGGVFLNLPHYTQGIESFLLKLGL
ncbi:MAG: hypothetical protein BWK79_03060 [Beggiatoa sp. IS2]|nr:MAG: hypothetical protein BWK79_03060 [Beggiatoa sp. IS2]